jgi:hypothetical protein
MKIINLLSVFFTLALWFSQPVLADDANAEYKIKAGYLYNFTKFITWPEDNSETFNLCIVGDDPFGELINPIEQRTAFGHPIKLFRLTRFSHEQRCHILFISASIKDNVLLKEMLLVQDTVKSLTVSENKDFAVQGGMIGFVKRQDRIQLQINQKTLQQSDLKISAKLLEVADIVEGDD